MLDLLELLLGLRGPIQGFIYLGTRVPIHGLKGDLRNEVGKKAWFTFSGRWPTRPWDTLDVHGRCRGCAVRTMLHALVMTVYLRLYSWLYCNNASDDKR